MSLIQRSLNGSGHSSLLWDLQNSREYRCLLARCAASTYTSDPRQARKTWWLLKDNPMDGDTPYPEEVQSKELAAVPWYRYTRRKVINYG